MTSSSVMVQEIARSLMASTMAQPGAVSWASGGNGTIWPQVPYRPFIDPVNLHEHWYWMLIPLAIGISIVYKAVRMRELRGYGRAVAVMSMQIIAGMVALAVGSYFLVMVFAKFIAERAHG
jgi:hypothetical protein